jgi:YesN/AraC family two-component response regulator
MSMPVSSLSQHTPHIHRQLSQRLSFNQLSHMLHQLTHRHTQRPSRTLHRRLMPFQLQLPLSHTMSHNIIMLPPLQLSHITVNQPTMLNLIMSMDTQNRTSLDQLMEQSVKSQSLSIHQHHQSVNTIQESSTMATKLSHIKLNQQLMSIQLNQPHMSIQLQPQLMFNHHQSSKRQSSANQPFTIKLNQPSTTKLSQLFTTNTLNH